jgi:hypothetical protein
MANLAAQPSGTDGETGKQGNGETEPGEQEPGSVHRPMAWSPEAERRLERIPEFIRPMVRQGIERLAAERGYQHVTDLLMDEVRTTFGM